MKDMLALLKEGNKSSLLAGIVNVIIAILKGVAFLLTGNVAMFAELLHSLGDAANQLFVFVGSALSRKAPTPKYPNGFGRIVNLACLGAVIIVAIMSYEAVKEGWKHVVNPSESSGVFINLTVLAIAILLEFYVLYKASKEIGHEIGDQKSGLTSILHAFKHLDRAKPPTKLVFMEDFVAAVGGIIAFIAVLLAHFMGILIAEGIASIIIGLMMFYVVGRLFLENARGAIGETDEEMLRHISRIVAEEPDVKDIQYIEVIKEGEFLHVEVILEVDPSHTVNYVDTIRHRLLDIILKQKSVREVTVSFDADDGIQTWTKKSDRSFISPFSAKFPK